MAIIRKGLIKKTQSRPITRSTIQVKKYVVSKYVKPVGKLIRK